MKFEDYLKRDAELYPNKTAIVHNDKSLTYSELWQQTQTMAESLPKGEKVVFRATQDIDFVIKYMALHLNGSVAIPVEKDLPEDSLQDIVNFIKPCQPAPEIADILFTTGSSGKRKGVMLIITGPMSHIASLSKIAPVLINGATLIMTEGMKNVNDFFDAMELPYKKFSTFLVPSAIRILLQFSGERLKKYADKIDFIETGAAAISAADIQQLCETLPHSRLYNSYASTESGLIATYNFNDGKCLEGCCGKTTSRTKIIITDEGLIACQGDTIMSGYACDDELTAKVMRNNTIYTTDYGRIDENGMLRLAGRADDIINTGGFKVNPTEIEGVALSMPQIADCICVAAPHPVLGTALKLVYVPKSEVTKKEIALYFKGKVESFKVPFYYEQAEKIQRTFNGKLDRKFYKNA